MEFNEAARDRPRLPPTGIEPIDEYGHGVSACRTSDKKSLIIFPESYKPADDPYYEDPDGSAFAWQNQEDAMDQLSWLKRIHEVNGADSHPRVQRLIQIQPGTEFPIVEFISKGDLYSFLRANPKPQVPSGKGSENPLALKLRWALNIASALAFLHTKSIIFEGLSPNTVHLRSDLSAVLVNLDVAAYKEQPGSDGVADGYLSPDWHQSPLADQPETWITTKQDVFAFGSLLYYLVEEEDPESFEGEDDMPELEEGGLGDIVRKCWLGEFETMDEVVR
ncbi:Receptor-interacting serine/threonine-protein kinase, partial [Lachnellula suecica]